MKGLIVIMLGSALPVLTSTNTMLYPIKKYYKLILFAYVSLIYYFLGAKIGQWITPIAIGGMILYIALINRKKALLNISSALLGYVCAVILNHIVIIVLSLFGLSVADISTRYAVSFSLIFTACACMITYLIGREIRKIWVKNEIKLKNNIKFIIVGESCIYLIITISYLILSESLGYPKKIILVSGIMLLMLMGISIQSTIKIIKIYEREKKAREKLSEKEIELNYTNKISELAEELLKLKE